MWSYYGSKSKIVNYYPSPRHDKIIEPFAGSARYSLKYFDHEVLLVDKYEVVIKIWKWLQQCSPKDILGLPKLTAGLDLRTLNISEEERMFLGMNAGIASVSPRNKVSPFAAIQNERRNKLKPVVDNLFKIKHWKFIHGDYINIPNQGATWFIDAPYQFGGNAYVENKIDFTHLAEWCKEREGQKIVCENTKADWLDFRPITEIHGAMSRTTEAFWSNHQKQYLPKQQCMF